MNKKMIVITLTLNSLISLISIGVALYLYLNIPKFVSFDMKNTTDTFLNQMAKLDISSEEQKAMMKKYERSIHSVINEQYSENNTIVFVKGAVMSKINDETPKIKTKLVSKMKEGNNE
ncbi:TrbI F-type domain-containing protein [Xenorhabdus ishibashii]|uniref:Type-F conjugative transfer system protein TrbI n=1 Tax=Xenorhabdus ishibashii TaxID=1034471 RepID=A0A2D0K8M0_9GAMM|nr:TrbI F-type domain-containing protein [Xenorhabdus ishibashii]PHM59557.1 hypothetical protein Xish_03676 [Xenorhabdus ishibashii]